MKHVHDMTYDMMIWEKNDLSLCGRFVAKQPRKNKEKEI